MEALIAEPVDILKALWWRMRGKRVRSRLLLAPVIGRTPHAYDLWIVRRERRLDASAAPSLLTPTPIVPVIDATGCTADAVTETLLSLESAGTPPVVVSSDGTFESFADAIGRLPWGEPFWLMPLRAGDRLAPRAWDAYTSAVSDASCDLVYGDDDLIDRDGHRRSPHFKPDWNSELYRHFDFVTGSGVVLASRVDCEHAASASDWMAALFRLAAKGGGRHLPLILHHRRSRPTPSVAALKPSRIDTMPSVTAIVPTRNRHDLLQACLDGLAKTDAGDLEVVVVDNGSDDPRSVAYLSALHPARHRVIRHPGPFNYSAMINAGAKAASGRYLCLLNNDLEFPDPGWLNILISRALEPDIGAVGGLLLYPDRTIQHAGIVLGFGDCAGHAHRGLRPAAEGYHRRHALPQLVSAVTGAMLLVERRKFDAVGGLNDTELKVAFSDVDFCLRLNARGWRTLYEPRAVAVHHESASRGRERSGDGARRLAREAAAFQRLWDVKARRDPWHHPQLSRYSEQFLVAP